MRLVPLSLILLAGASVPVLAQDSTEVLRRALDRMPEMLLTNPEPMQVHFLDMQAWRGLSPGEPSFEAMMRLALAQNILPLGVMNYGGLASWDEKAGAGLDEISFLAGFGQPPTMVAYWGFDSAEQAGQLIDTLGERNFVAVDGAVEGIIGNGEPNVNNLANRDPANPWIGALGKSSFALALDDVVIQAPAPEAMASLSQIVASVADNLIVASALDGLSGTVGVDQGRIIQAAVISPAFGLASFNPAGLLGTTDMAEAMAALEAAMEDAGQGIPPYFGGIIADVQYENRPALTVALAYPDCQTAEEAITLLEARWAQNMKTAAETDGRSVANDGELCAAVVNFIGEDAGDADNMLLRELLSRYMTREFSLLQIGAGS